jgi:hypothetical protein
MPRARKTPNIAPKSNRVDLQQAQAPVATVAPGSVPYGDRAKIEQAVQQVPLAADGGFGMAVQAASATPPPPQGGLLRPSERGFEPVQAGLGLGPGPGPEVLRSRPRPKPRVSDILDQMSRTGDRRDGFMALQADRARRMGI